MTLILLQGQFKAASRGSLERSQALEATVRTTHNTTVWSHEKCHWGVAVHTKGPGAAAAELAGKCCTSATDIASGQPHATPLHCTIRVWHCNILLYRIVVLHCMIVFKQFFMFCIFDCAGGLQFRPAQQLSGPCSAAVPCYREGRYRKHHTHC